MAALIDFGMGFEQPGISSRAPFHNPNQEVAYKAQKSNSTFFSIMKNAILLLAACAFATASFAQTPETEVKVRDNGTKKIVTKTGKTNTGKALENTADAAGNLAEKAGNGIKKGFKKSKKAVKSTTQKAGKKTVKATEKMEAKTE
jgi:hypothetical protein